MEFMASYVETTLQQHLFQILAIYIYSYEATSSINPFKQPKRALN